MMKRREFITLFGGAAAWPLAARAQQASSVLRLGVLLYSNPQADHQMETIRRALRDLGPFFANSATSPPMARITSGRRRTNCAANSGSRSGFPCA
jgi:hypothetical protein